MGPLVYAPTGLPASPGSGVPPNLWRSALAASPAPVSPLLAFPWLLQELMLSFYHVKPEAQTQPSDLGGNSLCPLKHVASLPLRLPVFLPKAGLQAASGLSGSPWEVIHMLNNSGCRAVTQGSGPSWFLCTCLAAFHSRLILLFRLAQAWLWAASVLNQGILQPC